MGNDQVRHVIFYVALKPGNLILAEMEDGHLCILRDDAPVKGCRWDGRKMVKAVATFHEMKQSLVEEPADPNSP